MYGLPAATGRQGRPYAALQCPGSPARRSRHIARPRPKHPCGMRKNASFREKTCRLGECCAILLLNRENVRLRDLLDVSAAYWMCGKKKVALDRPLVMAIVNVTPDSFYAGSRVPECGDAVTRGIEAVAAGADILDVGGESTRPGAAPVPLDEELRRVVPVTEALRAALPETLLSVDTRHTEVARAALSAGADIINDVSGCAPDAGMWETVAERGAGYVLMHARGNPETMDALTDYGDVVEQVLAELADGLRRLTAMGADRRQILIDPGLGFAKTHADSLRLLAATPRFAALGPTLVAASRKRFLGDITGQREAAGRGAASVAAALCAAAGGAAAVRVHDVRETVDALRVWAAVRKEVTRA